MVISAMEKNKCIIILNTTVRGGLTEKRRLNPRAEGSEKGSQVAALGKSIPGRSDGKCKGPEARHELERQKGDGMTEAELAQGRVEENDISQRRECRQDWGIV